MPAKEKKIGAAVETEEEVDKATLIVKDGDKEYRVHSDDFGPADTMVCRQQTGLPVEHYLTDIGADTMLIVIWMARRKSGEPNLPFANVMKRYKTNADMNKLEFDIKYDSDGDGQAVDPLVDAD